MASTGMQAEVSITGLNELRQRLKSLPQKMQGPAATRALQSGAKVIKERARGTTAWSDDTGFLREAIVQFAARKSEHEFSAQVRVGVRKRRVKRPSKRLTSARIRRQRRGKRAVASAYYWKYLEYGTSRMGAKPFMRPAFEATKADAARRIGDSLREQLEKVGA